MHILSPLAADQYISYFTNTKNRRQHKRSLAQAKKDSLKRADEMKKAVTNIRGKLRHVQERARNAAAKTGLFAFCKPEQIQQKRTSAQTINEADHRQPTVLQKPPITSIPDGARRNGPDQLSRTAKTASFADVGQMQSEPQVEANSYDAWQLEEGKAASYTCGSPRLVLAGDGSKPCVALLPDHDLVQKLRDAVVEKYCIEQAEEISDADVNRLQNTHNSIGLDIEDLEASIADVETPGTEEAKVRLRKQQKRLEKLRRKQKGLEDQKKASRRVLESRYRAERYNLHLLLNTVEEVLVRSKMLHPADETVDADAGENADAGEIKEPLFSAAAGDQGPTAFSTTEYEDGAQVGSRVRHKASTSDLNTSDSDSDISDPIDDEPEWTETAIIIRQYQSAQTRIRVMEEAFDTRQARFDEDAEERARKLDGGEEVESELAFDLRQVQITRQMAKQVTEAEEALQEAKAAAVAAGVQVPGSDIESGFVDDVNDGYRISSEEEVAASVSKPFVHVWMQAVSDGYTEDTSEVEIDNWDAKSVDISDSASMVADGAARNRIDRWRAACYALQ